jgi:ureidoacrylate peracid hydrolase
MMPASVSSEFPEIIDPARTALIVVDVQNDYCHPDGSAGRRGGDLSGVNDAVANIQRHIDKAREVGAAVIFVRNWDETWTDSLAWRTRRPGLADAGRAGSWGAELYKVEPAPGEPLINKQRYSAFVNTALANVLQTMERSTVLMTGTATNVCVESTARHAVFLDYRMVFLSDATATADGPDIQAATLTNMSKHFGTVASTDEVLAAWADRPRRNHS